MKKSKQIMIICFLVIAFIIITKSPLTVHATISSKQETTQTVRVGVYESSGFIAMDNTGAISGYGLNFMQQLAEYAGITYKFIPMSWSECLKQIESGKIDIVVDARRNTLREKKFDFSVECIGQIQGAIFVLQERPNIYFNDFEQIKKLKIGFEKGAINRTLYERYADSHGYIASTIEYESATELRKALKNGEIDAIGNNVQFYTDDLKVVSIFNTEPNYIMGKKDSDTMRRINLAIDQMYSEHPKLIAEQYSYLIDRQMFGEELFTREEAEYIKNHPVLKVAVPPDRKPASWYDAESESFHGIAIDMMEQLSKITGFKFEFVATDIDASATNMLEDSSISMAMPVVSESNYQGTRPILITDALYSLSTALIVKEDSRLRESSDFTVAIRKSNKGIAGTMSKYYPEADFIYKGTAQECLDDLLSDKVDSYVTTLYEAEYLLKGPRNEKLHIANYYSCPLDYCLALQPDSPKVLLNILNGGIALIGEEKRQK